MNPIFDTKIPEGFSNMNSYLFTDKPAELIEWLQQVFYATELGRTEGPEGIIRNSVLKIGNTCFMIAQSSKDLHTSRTAFYLYVNDVDQMFKRATDHGAGIVFQPDDMDFGDRQGGIIDPAGNYWWISKRLEEGPYKNA